MAEQKKKEAAERFALPEGRVINSSLFEKDQYQPERGQPGKPMYKIEIAFPKDDGTGKCVLDEVFARLQKFADDNWEPPADANDPAGLLNVDGGYIISGVRDGDKLAAKREKAGKKGDAYRGMWVIRANTEFNADGQSGPGGIEVFDEDVNRIYPPEKHKVYNGCYGHAVVSLGAWEDDDTGNHAITFYLAGFQKTKDGEKLASFQSSSTLFKPVGRKPGETAAEGSSSRRTRRG